MNGSDGRIKQPQENEIIIQAVLSTKRIIVIKRIQNTTFGAI